MGAGRARAGRIEAGERRRDLAVRLQAGGLLGGAVLTETIFSWPGIGKWLIDAIARRDYPVVLGTLFFFTLIGLVTKLISDLCYVWVDPRVKFD